MMKQNCTDHNFKYKVWSAVTTFIICLLLYNLPTISSKLTAAEPNYTDKISIEIGRGDTISELLLNNGINISDIRSLTSQLSSRALEKKILPGYLIVLKFSVEKSRKKLLSFRLDSSDKTILSLSRSPNGKFKKTESNQVIKSNRDYSYKQDKSETSKDKSRISKKPKTYVASQIKIRKGDSLEALMRAKNISSNDIRNAVTSIKKRFQPRKLNVGQSITIVQKIEEAKITVMSHFIISLSRGNAIKATRRSNGSYKTEKVLSTEISWGAPNPIFRPDNNLGITNKSIEAHVFEPKTKEDIELNKLQKEKDIRKNSLTTLTLLTRPGDTLAAIIEGAGISPKQKDIAVAALRKKFNPRRLRVGQEITILVDERGSIRTLEGVAIKLKRSNYIQVVKTSDGKFTPTREDELNFIALYNNIKTGEEKRTHADTIKATPNTKLVPSSEIKLTKTHEIIKPIKRPTGLDSRDFKLAGVSVAASYPQKFNTARNEKYNTKTTSNKNYPLPKKSKKIINVTIENGDTLVTALNRAGSKNAETEAIISAFRKIHNPRRLQIGQVLSLAFSNNNSSTEPKVIEQVRMNITSVRELIIKKDVSGNWLGYEIERPVKHKIAYSEGNISSSLYLSAKKAGLPNEILMEMVHIFGFAVDFQRDVKGGDHFDVLYEVVTDNHGESLGYGSVIQASLTLSGSKTEIFRYEFDNGSTDYFEESGKSVRRALMRTPINGARLSSGYGMRRHPVQGYNKMHRGLDFAAPTGTPIMSAGDGRIDKIGRNGSYGKYIRIRHNGTYSTAYAHLSRYAKNLRKGSRVKQGQVIGYVGSTGLSTGPHLHYEILSGGKQINPRKIRLPSGRQLKNFELIEFGAKVRKVRIIISEAKQKKLTRLTLN